MAQDKTTYRTLLQRIREWPLSRKLSLAAVAVISLALFAVIILQAQKAHYRVLYANLTKSEASSIIKWLKDHNVPYQLKNQGKAIYVPAGKVYKTRLDLAGAGLPKGEGVGFEIFDNQKFGVTKFTQEVNYQRALQGELARSIVSLGPVEKARVHLVLPEKRLLKEQQEKAKSSVMVGLKKGMDLAPEQIQGIVHLVSGSVEGLKASQVTVVNAAGKVLSEKSGGDLQALSPRKLKYKNSLEDDLEKRAQTLLDRAFGPGNALVRVTTDINFTKMQSTEEIFNPDGVVPRSEKISEKTTGKRAVGGVPGSSSNLQKSGDQAQSTPSSQTTETINYEISKTIREKHQAMGAIENLSVAVLVAENALPAGSEGSGGARQEKLQSVERLISSALGLHKDRGDRIETVAMPFNSGMEQGKAVQASAATGIYQYLPYAKYGLLFLAACLVFVFLVRPIIKTMRGEVTEHYKTVQQMELEHSEDSQSQDPTAKLQREIAQSEVTPAQIVKAWLKEG
jgi:flagellar M-ring protein FliF